MATEPVMPSNHLILCCPLLLLPSVFPSIRVFYNESALHIRWPKYWNFSFSINPSSEYSGLISEALHSNKEIHEDYVSEEGTEYWVSLSVKHSPGSRPPKRWSLWLVFSEGNGILLLPTGVHLSEHTRGLHRGKKGWALSEQIQPCLETVGCFVLKS